MPVPTGGSEILVDSAGGNHQDRARVVDASIGPDTLDGTAGTLAANGKDRAGLP
jgi:hypothetical protein